MGPRGKKTLLLALTLLLVVPPVLVWAKKPSKHPYDLYDHEMHYAFFEVAPSVTCDTCHADPESFGDRTKVNPAGCHTCHNSPNPPLPATNRCTLCHVDGPPKPGTHRTDWISRHQVFAKSGPEECRVCHTNARFCIDCHQKRETVEKRVHRRNFRLMHSIEARANPRRCDACHAVSYCQECHTGGGGSKR